MSNTLKLGNGKWATGKDTLLSFSDTNNNYKPLPFSFSRASSGTVINKEGLIETVGSGEPRIDFKDNTKGALLLEPSRTNLINQSQTFIGGWSKLNGVVVSDEKVTSPDGTLNASQLVFNGTTGGRIERGITGLTQGADYTVSVYARVSSGTQVVNFGSVNDFEYTLTTKWQRLTRTQPENDTTAYPRFRCDDAATIEIYAFQLEEGSYATSYIPTSGSAVTRVREEVNNENYLMSGLTDMAMFVDYELPNGNSSGFRNQLGFRDNNNANFYMIQFPSSNTYEFRYTGVANVNVDMTPSMSEQDFGLRRKILYTKTGTTLKVFCNGVQVSTVTSASATTFSTTSVILNAGANYDIEMKIKDWKLYNNGFTDAEAIALTTI